MLIIPPSLSFTIRRSLSISTKVHSEQAIGAEDIKQVLSHLNLKANWKDYSWSAMRHCELPAMLILNDGHAVTLLSLHKDFAVISDINDDKVESHQLSLNDLKANFSGKVLQIEFQESQGVSSNRLRIPEWIDRKTLSFTLLEIIIASLMINLFQIALPLYTMNVYDKVIPNQAVETLWVLFSGILVILLLDYLFRLVRGVVMENLSERVGEALELRMVRKFITSNVRDREHVGAEVDMFHEMSNYRAGFFGKTLVELIEFPFFFLFFLVIYGISPAVSVVPLIAVVLVTVTNLFHHFPLQRLGKELFALKKMKESFLIQTISGRDSLRLANALSKSMYRWQSKVRKTLSLGRSSQLWNSSMATTTPIIVQGVSVMVIFVGSFQVFSGQLTVGGMVAATILSARAVLPILNFSNALTRLFSSRHMLKAWKAALTKPSDFDLHDNLLNKGHFQGNLMAKNLRFKYQNSPRWVIDNFNVQLKAGEHTGIVVRENLL